MCNVPELKPGDKVTTDWQLTWTVVAVSAKYAWIKCDHNPSWDVQQVPIMLLHYVEPAGAPAERSE